MLKRLLCFLIGCNDTGFTYVVACHVYGDLKRNGFQKTFYVCKRCKAWREK